MIALMRWIVRVFLLIMSLGGIAWFHHARTHRPTRVEEAGRAGILLIGNGSEPATLDHQLASGQPEHHIFHAIFEGLIAPLPENPDGDGPGAAETWTHENFTTWTFKLQPQGKWSDGTPLTSADFPTPTNASFHPDSARTTRTCFTPCSMPRNTTPAN